MKKSAQSIIDEKILRVSILHSNSKVGKWKLLADHINKNDLDIIAIRSENHLKRPTYYYNGRFWENKAGDKISELCKRYWPSISKSGVGEVIFSLQTANLIDTEDFENTSNHVVFNNTQYDLKTFKKVKYDRDQYITNAIPTDYLPGAKCPNFEKFVSEIVDKENIPKIQEMFGFCLERGYNYEQMIMLVGGGANGKSILLKILEMMVGKDNTCGISLQDFVNNRFRAAGIVNKMVNIVTELPNKAIRETGLLKALVSYENVTLELKGGAPFAYRSSAKQIFSTNEIPFADDNTHGWFRRQLIVEFPNTFTENKKKREQLIDSMSREMSGILNWALKGLKRLQKRGHMNISNDPKILRKAYLKRTDSIRYFIDERTDLDPNVDIACAAFIRYYRSFCKKNKLRAKSTTMVTQTLKKMGIEKQKISVHGVQIRHYTGVNYKMTKEDIQEEAVEMDMTVKEWQKWKESGVLEVEELK